MRDEASTSAGPVAPEGNIKKSAPNGAVVGTSPDGKYQLHEEESLLSGDLGLLPSLCNEIWISVPAEMLRKSFGPPLVTRSLSLSVVRNGPTLSTLRGYKAKYGRTVSSRGRETNLVTILAVLEKLLAGSPTTPSK
jgi:hypothetical protein